MKRALWIGTAILVAAVLAIPLWLLLENSGGDRRAAALVEPTGGGDVGILTLKTAQIGTVTVPV